MSEGSHDDVAATAACGKQERLTFGAFSFFPVTRTLYRDGAALALGGRMADILLALLSRPGELLPKEDLLARAWPGRTVEEVNLRTQIAALRRVLGCGGESGARYIATVAGRGYRFVATVGAIPSGEAYDEPTVAAHSPTIGPPLTPLIGRSQPLAEIVEVVRDRRQVTITGPGGIGKTRLALAAADALSSDYRDTVFLDCGTLQGDLRDAVAASMGVAARSGRGEALRTALPSSAHLFVIDGCEDRIDEAAELAWEVVRRAPRSAVILTSREPIGAAPEAILRLGPLDVPVHDDLPATTLMKSSAVELFFARAPLGLADPAAGRLATIARLCRQLEGNPFAIELAAAQIDRRGLEGLADMAGTPAMLRLAGPRTAAPRNRSLEASIDHDFRRLSAVEQGVILSMSVFTRAFSLDAAHALAPTPARDLEDQLAGLAAKSLLIVGRSNGGTTFAMPHMVRLYAFERLARSPRHALAMSRLAQHLRRELEERTAWCCVSADELARALDWCFARGEREDLALALTLAAVPFWFDTGAFGDALARLNQALALVADGSRRDVELRVRAALVTLLASRIGPPQVQLDAASTLISLAGATGDTAARSRGEWALWSASIWSGDIAAARVHAERVETIARSGGDPEARIAADRLTGIVLHFAGEHQAALDHLDRVLAYYPLPEWRTQNIPYQYDQRIVSLCYRARILHLQGDTGQALRTAETALAEGEAMGHLLSITYVLAIATCPILIAAGRTDAAREAVARLRAATDALRIPAWQDVATLFEKWLVVAHDPSPRLIAVNRALATVRASPFGPVRAMALCSLMQALARAGALPEARALIPAVIADAERRGEQWILPEARRLRADLLVRVGGPACTAEALAEAKEALELARRQGATSYADAIRRSIEPIKAEAYNEALAPT